MTLESLWYNTVALSFDTVSSRWSDNVATTIIFILVLFKFGFTNHFLYLVCPRRTAQRQKPQTSRILRTMYDLVEGMMLGMVCSAIVLDMCIVLSSLVGPI